MSKNVFNDWNEDWLPGVFQTLKYLSRKSRNKYFDISFLISGAIGKIVIWVLYMWLQIIMQQTFPFQCLVLICGMFLFCITTNYYLSVIKALKNRSIIIVLELLRHSVELRNIFTIIRYFIEFVNLSLLDACSVSSKLLRYLILADILRA